MTTTPPRPNPDQHHQAQLVGDLDERRRFALSAAVAEAATGRAGPDPDSWEPTIGTCVYGIGCLALALSGTFDPAGLERLRALSRDLDRLAHAELVIDFSGLATCDQPLARAVATLRTQRLAMGCHVELHNPPAALTTEIGAHPAESYTLTNTPG